MHFIDFQNFQDKVCLKIFRYMYFYHYNICVLFSSQAVLRIGEFSRVLIFFPRGCIEVTSNQSSPISGGVVMLKTGRWAVSGSNPSCALLT